MSETSAEFLALRLGQIEMFGGEAGVPRDSAYRAIQCDEGYKFWVNDGRGVASPKVQFMNDAEFWRTFKLYPGQP